LTASRRLFESDGAVRTEAVGATLAGDLRPGDVVFVAGELGAGKTTLVRGACRALGVQAVVTSPTFAIGHRYRTGGTLVVAHIDLYRLSDLGREDPELLGDYLGPERITFVEWPERADGALGRPRISVEIRHAGADRRAIEVRG
jgi:tRNA threonylcarbamoyladenosine biosynthesis protein TsaE